MKHSPGRLSTDQRLKRYQEAQSRLSALQHLASIEPDSQRASKPASATNCQAIASIRRANFSTLLNFISSHLHLSTDRNLTNLTWSTQNTTFTISHPDIMNPVVHVDLSLHTQYTTTCPWVLQFFNEVHGIDQGGKCPVFAYVFLVG